MFSQNPRISGRLIFGRPLFLIPIKCGAGATKHLPLRAPWFGGLVAQIVLKIIIIKTEYLYMNEEKKNRTEIEKNVEHLRHRLTRYKIVGIAPPINLLFELKMAERILQLESIDSIRFYVKA
jgi:hypothetical protein